MNINAASMINANEATASGNAPTAAAGSERNMFMTLLVAQLKNQDPLQPQDGTAFVAQLAQFNSLDQLMGIRESIEQLTIQMQQIQQQQQPPATTGLEIA